MAEKPPIGPNPHWFVYNDRMKQLSEAISKYIDYAGSCHGVEKKQSYDAIAGWCEELKSLALLESRLEGERIGRMDKC